MNPFKPFFPYIKLYRRALGLGISLLFLAQLVTTFIPIGLGWAIDAARAGVISNDVAGVRREVGLYALVIAALAVLNWAINFGMRWYLTSTSRKVERDVRQAYVNHLLELPLTFFHRRQVGDLMARATNDVEAIQRFLSHAFRMTLMGISIFCLSLGVMCMIDWRLALYSLIPVPVMVFSASWVSGRMRSGYRRVQEQFAVISTRIQENLAGIRVVKAYARRSQEIARFDELNEQYIERNRRLIHISSVFFPFTALLNGVSMVIILWLGGIRVIEGGLSLGEFVAFNAYLIRMSRPMMLLGRMVDEFQRANASLERINAILLERPQPLESGDERVEVVGQIEFRQASFAYDGPAVLQEVEVRLSAGQTLAVVGRVGSGKTTLARLLPRLINATGGQVLVDGTPVEEIPLPALRAAIGYVPQDTFLFSDTIRANIALGLEGQAEEGLVEWAAEVAQLTPDLENLSDGLETIVGERGVTLSGGQKQRTALARAIVRKPQILVLDDALASVDTRTEEAILRGLRQVMATRTTLIIAHRISTVKDADHIIVMDAGRIVEQGSHDALVALDGPYADMHRRQHLSEELSEL